MEERWSTEHILSLAPDAASRAAAGPFSAPAAWSAAGSADGTVWGLCAGSGGAPYRTVVELTGPAYQCSCPSRKSPCKHALGLLLLWSRQPQAVPDGGASADWAANGAAGRQRAARGPADPVAARRRAERRAARVADGARELRLRLADRVRQGLAGAAGDWDEVAARMVDAQAPGLAARVRELATLPSEEQLARYALLDLLAAAYQRVDELPGALAATVRSRVGFSIDSAELLAGPTVRDRWLALGCRERVEGPLTSRRLWLRGARSGRQALLLDYDRPGQPAELALPVGHSMEAELAFHPGVRPLRAVLGPRQDTPVPAPGPPRGRTVAEAVADYGEAVAEDPWTDAWPVPLAEVVPVRGPDGWLLTDDQGALPVGEVDSTALWRLVAVAEGRPLTVFGECGHRGFTPVTVWDRTGRAIDLSLRGAA
ncbi:SWIM zinc finger family protein [Kitasatospora sp. GAS1066B]|uniref:SWIM zinc finger family protein n=1 Tax=Kitasatospora sp. GAS1066B TaxID=3156271 RepID=UPI003512067C